ncbi:DNA polymerase [Silvimonas sp.]|uniref:DNA polymerase n=1 Tax=Silvimonas sp. TaxID=2650811 RepID=UPI00283C2350|nr:DNA polymerase [Silvimonas sp.]MDR3427783.1 DNA polymerase [Silvimonas sp.]
MLRYNDAWDDARVLTFDFETSGTKPEYALQPWRVAQGKAWVTSLVYSTTVAGERVVEGGLFPSVEMMRSMLQKALDEDLTIVGWNVAFDIAWLIAAGLEDLVMRCNFLDAMLLWRHAEIEPEYEMTAPRRKSYSLKTFVKEYMPGHAGYEDDVDFHDTGMEARAKLHAYNERDVEFTLVGAQHWWNSLQVTQRRAAMIEARAIPLAARANLQGLPVDMLAARELDAKLENDATLEGTKLAFMGVDTSVLRSPIKLGRLLFDDWKLPVLKENTSKITGNTSRSTDKEVLHELAFLDPRAQIISAYREAENNRVKFARTPIASAEYNEDGRVHPSAMIFGTYSGRLTYASKQRAKGPGKRPGTEKLVDLPTGFAIHQEKRGALFRGVLIPPPGYGLMEFDAAGQEFRWMAVASGDEAMLQLCQPGEDPHSYMGSRIVSVDYHWMIANQETDKDAENGRKLGKVANLCVAGGTMILTDRGPCSIEHVRPDDLVWDGVEFVQHSGVSFSGVRDVITYQGLTATPDHRVWSMGGWRRLDEAQRFSWPIERACSSRSAVRIVDGLVRRTFREIGGTLCARAMRLWGGTRGQPAVHGDGTFSTMQGMCCSDAPSARREADYRNGNRQTAPEARQRDVSEMHQPERSVVPQLRRPWDRVSVWLSNRGSDVHQTTPAPRDIPGARYRPARQRWSLRAWKLALGYTQGEPRQQTTARTYDIVNCGLRTRFAANGLIVHNSLQYRTSAGKLRSVARVQYNIPMELPEARRIHTIYQRTYPRVPKYWEEQIRLTKRTHYVETFAGRRVKVDGDWSGNFGWSMGSTAINYRIQGTGADQKYLALAVIKPYLTQIGAYFAWDLHDGIYLFVPLDKMQRAAIDIKYLLDNLPYKRAWGYTPPIPMPWDAKMGGSWGDLKKVHIE